MASVLGKVAHTQVLILFSVALNHLKYFYSPSPGWDASPSHDYPPPYPSIKFTSTLLYTCLGGERHCESKVFFPRTQHTDPCQGWNLDCFIRCPAHTNFFSTLVCIF